MAIILPILSTFNAAGIKAAQGQLAGLGKSLKGLVGPAAAATLGVQALQGAVRFAGEAVAEARDLERNMAALGTVFGNLEPRMKTFVDNAYNMGLSQVDAARTSTFLGSVLKQAGLPMDEVANKTEQLTILAQDLATTYGYDTSEALTAMTALFRGEYDPIEKFGVALKQNEVNALVAAKGLGHLTGQEMLNAQQTVRMEQLFLRSADAAGAFARQSGTLFVEQKKLTAVFDNMQAAVGGQLTPALAGLMQELTPIVEDLTPVLTQTFSSIGTVIDVISPIVGSLGDIFVDLLDTLTLVTDAIAGLAENAAPYLIGVFDLLAETVDVLNTGLQQIGDFLGDLSGWAEDFNNSDVGKFFISWSDSIVASNRGLQLMLDFLDRIKARGTEDLDANKLTVRQADRINGFVDPLAKVTPDKKTKGDAKNAVKDFYDQLADELAKQSARLKLKNKGLSTDLIESIVGSGEDWQKVFNNVKNLSKSGIYELQSQFRKTAAGQKEIANLQEQLQAKEHERYLAAKEDYDNQKKIWDAQVSAIEDLRKALNDTAASVIPLAVVTREIGAFESSTISAFENIANTIAKALADGTLLKSAADNLTAYARKEQEVIQKLMAQRDEIVNKRSMAKAMLDDVKAAVIGVGNITTLLQAKTEQITQSVTKMVGNITVVTSKTIEQVTGTGAGDLISSFTNILTKTKAFAEQLKQLRALGLDNNLYKQIVDAGIDAGGQTAKAILEGGAGTVSELNSVFNELNMAGEEIAKQSAEVMYGAGVDLTDGLINGLISQEQKLIDTATTLANSFMSAFNSQVNIATPISAAPIAPVEETIAKQLQPVTYTLDQLSKIDLKTVTTDSLWKEAAALAKKLIATPQYKPGTVVNVTVKADVTTNGKTAGQAILAELNKYAKANS